MLYIFIPYMQCYRFILDSHNLDSGVKLVYCSIFSRAVEAVISSLGGSRFLCLFPCLIAEIWQRNLHVVDLEMSNIIQMIIKICRLLIIKFCPDCTPNLNKLETIGTTEDLIKRVVDLPQNCELAEVPGKRL